MKLTNTFQNISVVLVNTYNGGNIGSVARAMKNMGLSRLKLVNPSHYMDEECRAMARGAVDLLSASCVFLSLDEALAGENVVIGTTSGRERREEGAVKTPRDIISSILRYASSQRVALVFGPERRGLSDAQLARCQYVVSIPTDEESPVLNLAQSVMIIAYEIFTSNNTEIRPGVFQLASDDEREQMFRQMEQVLVEVGFLSTRNPSHIMRAFRRVLERSSLTPRDVRIFRGAMSQLLWYAKKRWESSTGTIRKP